MDTRRYADARAFLNDARELLTGNPAQNQVLLSVAEMAAEQPDVYPQFHAFAVFEGGPLVAATQTPPHNFLLSESRGLESIPVLAETIHDSALEVPGILGIEPHISGFSSAWAVLTGDRPEVVTRQGVFSLEEVSEIALAPGGIRHARKADRDLLIRWWEEFYAEALPEERARTGRTEERVDLLLEPGRKQGMHLWEVDGEVVSMSGFSPPVAEAIRIGPVYTPSPMRGQGFATALVASQSRLFLDAGHTSCLLHTDLTNPTSNAIYKRIGYHQVAEATEYRFVR